MKRNLKIKKRKEKKKGNVTSIQLLNSRRARVKNVYSNTEQPKTNGRATQQPSKYRAVPQTDPPHLWVMKKKWTAPVSNHKMIDMPSPAIIKEQFKKAGCKGAVGVERIRIRHGKQTMLIKLRLSTKQSSVETLSHAWNDGYSLAFDRYQYEIFIFRFVNRVRDCSCTTSLSLSLFVWLPACSLSFFYETVITDLKEM